MTDSFFLRSFSSPDSSAGQQRPPPPPPPQPGFAPPPPVYPGFLRGPTFICPGSGMRIPLRLECNGVADCPGGEDEAVCGGGGANGNGVANGQVQDFFKKREKNNVFNFVSSFITWLPSSVRFNNGRCT